MYQHPAALDLSSDYYRDEAMRCAENRRLVHQVTGDRHTPTQHWLVAAAVSVLMLLAVVALI
jgi:hypothetical protein